MRAMLDSAEQLKAAFAALNSDLLHQMAYLAINTDPVIARATWEIFSPSFNLTMESVVFASIVGILIWLVFFVVWTIVASLINLLTAR